jgi:hypothetical protein
MYVIEMALACIIIDFPRQRHFFVILFLTPAAVCSDVRGAIATHITVT